MSDSSGSHDQGPAEGTVLKVGFEPDDVPTQFLTTISAVLTITVVAMVLGTVWYFRVTVANELAEKGYTATEHAPRSAGQVVEQ